MVQHATVYENNICTFSALLPINFIHTLENLFILWKKSSFYERLFLQNMGESVVIEYDIMLDLQYERVTIFGDNFSLSLWN